MTNLSLFRRSWIPVAVLLLATEALYLRPSFLTGEQSLGNMDYNELHYRRILFAQNALFGPRHTVPAWYPHELLGSSFSASLQNFPWIPTRLPLLFLNVDVAYAAGVNLAAALAALFTYLFCRRIGIGQIGAAAAAWTFACSGMFATRVLAGHLPLLEVYLALPLLLWLSDRAVCCTPRFTWDLGALAFGSACLAVGGHPQLPIYAFAVALMYIACFSRGRVRLECICALALGIGTTLVALWPLFLLIQRSTRVLPLAPALNDIAFPYRRLLAMLLPWRDGCPATAGLSAQPTFHGFPRDAYFWETASYIGVLPLIFVGAFLFASLIKKRLPKRPWIFLASAGSVALLLALPLTDPLRHLVPGTFLRSPARLAYIPIFSVSAAFGFGIDTLLRSGALNRYLKYSAVAFCLMIQILDLGSFSRMFVQEDDPLSSFDAPFEQTLAREVKDSRVALDIDGAMRSLDRYDDVGSFDSIFLAAPYRVITGLNGAPRQLNEEVVVGSDLKTIALRSAGAAFVVTMKTRNDLELLERADGFSLYRVPSPAKRATLVPRDKVDFTPMREMVEAFVQNPQLERMRLPAEARYDGFPPRPMFISNEIAAAEDIEYRRLSSDEIVLTTTSARASYVRLIEAYDPGWSAEVDGTPTQVFPADGFVIGIPVNPGRHLIRLRYHTPGRSAGLAMSLVSVLLLAGLLWTASLKKATVRPSPAPISSDVSPTASDREAHARS